MTQEEKDLEEALDSIEEKVQGMHEDLELGEALGVLEEAVGEVESLGEMLEEEGS